MDFLAPLDLAGLKPCELRDQPMPEVQWAPVDDLVIDRRYQRDLTGPGKRAIKRMAADWDWTKYAPILCARVDGGRLAVVDGQHRAHAAALCGVTSLPAMIVPMSLQQQAAAFAAVNKQRVAVHSLAVYRAELAAGADWAVAVDRAVSAAGCRMATSNHSTANKKPGVVYATGLIRKMVDAGEAVAVTRGLEAVRGSLQGDVIRPYDGAVLGVWLPALARNQAFLRLDLSDAFDEIDIDTMLEENRARVRQLGGSARGLTISEVVRFLSDMRAAA